MTVDIVLGDTRTCEDLISNRITCIDGVPHFLRELNKEAYAPRVISIGPFHNQPCSERLQTMQGIRERYSKYFWQRATVENIANRARSNVETPFPTINEQMMRQIRKFYGGTITLSDTSLS